MANANASLPDLRPIGVAIHFQPDGNAFDFAYHIRNSGDGAAQGGFQIGLTRGSVGAGGSRARAYITAGANDVGRLVEHDGPRCVAPTERRRRDCSPPTRSSFHLTLPIAARSASLKFMIRGLRLPDVGPFYLRLRRQAEQDCVFSFRLALGSIDGRS
jgi:hypothetical protein